MEFTGNVDDKPFHFSLEKIKNEVYEMIVDGIPHQASIRYCGDGYLEVYMDGQQMEFFVSTDEEGKGYVSYKGFIFNVTRNDILVNSQAILGSMDHSGGKHDGKIISPMPGKVIKINVGKGDEVKRGQTLIIVEAMKMENYIVAPHDGVVEVVNVKVGDMVNSNTRLIEIS